MMMATNATTTLSQLPQLWDP